MTDMPLVIVVAYRADEHLSGALETVSLGDRVVVVDNDASESTRAHALAHGARYVRAPENVGFAAGVNLGLAEAWDERSDVLLLNPDARITATAVADLATALHATPRCAAVGPRLVGPDGQAQAADWPMPSPGQVWADAVGLGRRWKGRRFITGAVLLLNGAALAELGGLDERYFLYAEEADWQQRAQEAGWTVRVVDSVTATHVGAASSSDPARRERHFHDSAVAFAQRWHGRRGTALMRAGSAVAAARRALTNDAAARAEARRTLQRYLRGPRSGR